MVLKRFRNAGSKLFLPRLEDLPTLSLSGSTPNRHYMVYYTANPLLNYKTPHITSTPKPNALHPKTLKPLNPKPETLKPLNTLNLNPLSHLGVRVSTSGHHASAVKAVCFPPKTPKPYIQNPEPEALYPLVKGVYL